MGENTDGQLGVEGYQYLDQPTRLPQLSNIGQISAGRNHTIVVSQDSKLFYG